MKRKYSLKLRLYSYFATPAIMTVLIVIGASANTRVPGLAEFMPYFALMAIFFWTIYAPMVMPQWLCLILGLLQDGINGSVFGVSSLIYIAFWGIVYSQRRFLIKENFMVLYGIFILASLVISIAYWLLFSLVSGHIYFTPSILMQWFFTITLYPLAHLLFSNLYLSMARLYRYA